MGDVDQPPIRSAEKIIMTATSTMHHDCGPSLRVIGTAFLLLMLAACVPETSRQEAGGGSPSASRLTQGLVPAKSPGATTEMIARASLEMEAGLRPLKKQMRDLADDTRKRNGQCPSNPQLSKNLEGAVASLKSLQVEVTAVRDNLSARRDRNLPIIRDRLERGMIDIGIEIATLNRLRDHTARFAERCGGAGSITK
jgi:hypothetical protein